MTEHMKGATQSQCRVHIGTSGWHYKHWLGPFYPTDLPAKGMLSWYMERFDTVELNNSFYHLPKPRDVRSLAAGHACVILLCREREPIHYASQKVERSRARPRPVHGARANRWATSSDRSSFSTAATVVVQPAAPERLLERCRRPTGIRSNFAIPAGTIPPSIEHWDGTMPLSVCMNSTASRRPSQLTADFVYVRLHGPGRKYQGDYSSKQLRGWAERITRWKSEPEAVYVYFDNDQAGYAAKNAAELKSMVTSMRILRRSTSGCRLHALEDRGGEPWKRVPPWPNIPFHPMLIPFPIALWIFSLASDLFISLDSAGPSGRTSPCIR